MSDDVDPHVSASEQAPTDSDANTSWSKDRLAARVWGLARRAGKVWATQGEPREVGRLGIEPRTALPGLFSLFFYFSFKLGFLLNSKRNFKSKFKLQIRKCTNKINIPACNCKNIYSLIYLLIITSLFFSPPILNF
jgi:hypothetical protein